MSIVKFKLTNIQSIELAECENVPPVMIITGPNGVGKSTLLYALRNDTGYIQPTVKIFVEYERSKPTRTLYLAPHRVWEEMEIPTSALWDNKDFGGVYDLFTKNIISQDGSSGSIQTAKESHQAPDKNFGFIKKVLASIEGKRRNLITQIFNQKGAVSSGDIGDIYSPLKQFTQQMFPYLRFIGITSDEYDGVQILFERSGLQNNFEVSFEKLSSGERAAISLFLPFLETQVTERLKQAQLQAGITQTNNLPQYQLVVLIDEPEQHLHPALQIQLLKYIRTQNEQFGHQFVLVTHSPAIMSQANSEELYLLTKPTVDPGYNQLVQIATSENQLQAIRDLCGDTQVITSCRNIICVEGENPSEKIGTDAQLLRLICPEIASNIILPFNGKSEVRKTAKQLRQLISINPSIISVFAVVDNDQGTEASEEWVIPLPAAMIENILLEPDIIWKVLEPYKDLEKLALNSPQDIQVELERIAYEERENEIRLRIRQKLGSFNFPLEGITSEQILQKFDDEIERIKGNKLSDLESKITSATQEVDLILSQRDELKKFHGKNILKKFFNLHINQLGIFSIGSFMTEIARRLGGDDKARQEIFDALKKTFDLN